MANTICFENGVKHELTAYEISVLKLLLEDADEGIIPVLELPFKEVRKYEAALANLKTLFLEQLD